MDRRGSLKIHPEKDRELEREIAAASTESSTEDLPQETINEFRERYRQSISDKSSLIGTHRKILSSSPLSNELPGSSSHHFEIQPVGTTQSRISLARSVHLQSQIAEEDEIPGQSNRGPFLTINQLNSGARSVSASDISNQGVQHGNSLHGSSPAITIISEPDVRHGSHIDSDEKNQISHDGQSPNMTASQKPSANRRISQQALSLPEQKDAVGRTMTIDTRLPSITDAINFDPIPISSNPIIIGGPLRILFFPLIVLGRAIAILTQRIQYGNVKGKFIDNTVKTARYSPLDFLPKQLVMQFSKFANLYFLFVSILQMIPGWSPTGTYTTIFPLSVFVILAMVKEGYEDWERHKHDAEENGNLSRRLRRRFTSDESNSDSLMWESLLWKDIQVGDVLCIEDGEVFPADVVVLSSSAQNGLCLIETSNLDGESNLKQKQALSVTQNQLIDISGFENFACKIQAESPSGDIYQFEGNIDISTGLAGKHALTVSQMVPRGATLTGTACVYGVAVYTGEEAKIRKNATKEIKTKAPALEKLTNIIVVLMFLIVIGLATITTCLSVTWDKTKIHDGSGHLRHWYLGPHTVDIVSTFFSNIILYNTMIPISLYVTMEFVKLVLVYFINHDINMYDEASDCAAKAQNSNLHEDLGQVQYLFTDKTGTLTQNVMMFKKLSVSGTSYFHGLSNEDTIFDGSKPAASLISEILARTNNVTNIDELEQPHRDAANFLLAISLCHTVSPERKQNNRGHPKLSSGRTRAHSSQRVSIANNGLPYIIPLDDLAISYQSSSPDEIALAEAARELTFTLRGRTVTTVTLNALLSSREDTFTILNTIEFTSRRKRMSVIYRYPDGKIVLLCKGADSVILERLQEVESLTPWEVDCLNKTVEHLAEFATEGLRTLLYAKRELNEEKYEIWLSRWQQASLALTNRTELMEIVAEEIECELKLLGATAIEDRLQDGVPQTIDKFRRAGIKIWMLTGDKKETAVNIAYTCQIAKGWSEMLTVEGKDLSALEKSISSALRRCQTARTEKSATSNFAQKEMSWHAVSAALSNSNLQKTISPSDEKKSPHIIALIDGDAITKLEHQYDDAVKRDGASESLLISFLRMGLLCDGVICCRFSPSQKALLVSQVRNIVSSRKAIDEMQGAIDKNKSVWKRLYHQLYIGPCSSGVTLAIGDGANDIPMIQCAHVGIGITGREGLAASRAADYSIAQFRFLQPLLFVHGRWAYHRICLFTLATFYKCLAFYLTQMYFQIFTAWSGTSVYEQWTLTLYNILFSSLPVIVVGVFEKDLNLSTIYAVPELYRYGQKNHGLNMTKLLQWVFLGAWHAAVAIFIPAIMYNGLWNNSNIVTYQEDNSEEDKGNVFQIGQGSGLHSDMAGPYQETSIYALGTMSYTIVITLVNLKIGYMSSHNWTIWTHVALILTIIFWWTFIYVYSLIWPALGQSLGPDSAGMWKALTGSMLRFWLVQVLAVAGALSLDALLLSGIWRFSSTVTKAMNALSFSENAELDNINEFGVEDDPAVERMKKQPSPPIRNSRPEPPRTSRFYRALAAAHQFAANIISSSQSAQIYPPKQNQVSTEVDKDQMRTEAKIGWGELTPLWQLWERKNNVTADLNCVRDIVSADKVAQAALSSKSTSFYSPMALSQQTLHARTDSCQIGKKYDIQ